MKDHAFAGREICCRDSERNAEFFKGSHLQSAIEKPDHALVAGKAEARKRPTCEMLEAHPGRHLFEFGRRMPATIGRTDERSHTRPGHKSDGNFFFFEDFQNSDVSDAAGESTTQRNADPRRSK